MYIVELQYSKPLAEIEAHMHAHVEWLKHWYREGLLVMSGPKSPRNGSILVVRARDQDVLWEMLRQDPFHELGLVQQVITEFHPSRYMENLEALLGQ